MWPDLQIPPLERLAQRKTAIAATASLESRRAAYSSQALLFFPIASASAFSRGT